MLFSNICKVGTLTALALAITACGSNSPDTPTNNPTTIPTAPTNNTKPDASKTQSEKEKADKAKAEADAKAEAEKKAQAEKARLEAEAKAKAEFIKPKDFTYHNSYFANRLAAANNFKDLLAKTTDDKGQVSDSMYSILVMDNSGVQVSDSIKKKDLTYQIYSNHLSNSAIALISVDSEGWWKPDYLYTYGGKATNANELETLKGQAEYIGQGFMVADRNSNRYGGNGPSQAVVNMTADFDTKKISGNISNGQATISLLETSIRNADGALAFDGKAAIGDYTGTYDGKFMGQGARELAGQVAVASVDLGAVFSAKKVE